MDKQELRKSFLQKRLSLNDGEYHELNRRLCEIFFASVDLGAIHSFHTYLPMEKKKEPDTWPIIKRIEKDFPDMQISIPKVVDDHLESFHLVDRGDLKTSSWGISELDGGSSATVVEIDLVLVPLLAFDRTGHRVGYGRGFYDRFLRECRPDCKKVGLSFFGPVPEIDRDPRDIQLTHCITPEQLYSF